MRGSRWVQVFLGVVLCLGPIEVRSADCNGNGRDDRLDVEEGFSSDCNEDGVPDECEVTPIGFTASEELEVGGLPTIVKAADIDGDGDADIITAGNVARSDSSISIIINAGDSFLSPARYPAGDKLRDFTAADLDGDGRPEVITVNLTTLLVFPNAGVGELAVPPESVELGSEARSLIASDIDGDGQVDVVTANRETDDLSILYGDGAGGLGEPLSAPAGDGPQAVAAGDFDADGDIDLAVANRISRDVTVLLNAGGRELVAGGSLETPGDAPVEVLTADLDGDGSFDLVVPARRSLLVFAGGEGGLFAEPVRYPGAPISTAIADADSDGDPDLLLGARPSGLSVRFNDGSGRLGVSRGFPTPGLARTLAVGDFDRDGDPDLATISPRRDAIVPLWNGESASFDADSSRVPLVNCEDSRGCRPHSGVGGDFDGDGHPDVLACITHRGSFSFVRNDGRGALEFAGTFVFGGEHPQSVAAGDLDGDGDLDAVTVDNLDHQLYAHLNRGDGRFERPARFRVGTAPINVQLGDLDGDGDLDAVSANESSNNVSVLLGDGAGRFTAGATRHYRVRAAPKAVALADLDGDGALDIAVANSASAEVSVLLNEGGGSFSQSVGIRLRASPNHVAAADLDNDGDADLATANPARASSSVLLNRGDGTFEDPSDFPAGHAPYSVITVDFDGDGLLDLVTGSERQNNVAVLLGTGDGSFQPPFHYPGGTGLRFIVPLDLEGDGDVDLVTIDREGHSVTVIRSRVAEEKVAYLERICTPAEFYRVSTAEGARGDVRRFVKFLLPARDDDSLLPPVFQNTGRFDLHEDFLREVFPDRFPALDRESYRALVERRASRDYYAGVLSLIRTGAGPIHGFSVVTDVTDPAELLTLDEVRGIHAKLSEVFLAAELYYAPSSRREVERAAGWKDPGFPIHLGDASAPAAAYEAYTRGVGFGTVRILNDAEFLFADVSGGLSFQDILVLDSAPRDINGVVSGVITAEPQGELSHVAVRTARRGTPNAFVEGARQAFEAFEGELARLEVRRDGFSVRRATLEEAEAWWAASRPELSEDPSVDADFDRIATLEEISSMELEGIDVPLEARFGGKASNFARLQRILDGAREVYREPGFAVPLHYYLEFLRSNRLPSLRDPGREVTYEEHIGELLADEEFRSDARFRSATLRAFREHMEDHSRVPSSLVRSLAGRIEEVFGTTRRNVRFRSSSNVEDILEFNGAGLYDSTSACAADNLDLDGVGPSRCDASRDSERGIDRALRRVWASLWNFRAFEEREFFGVPQDLSAMGVLVTRAFPDERANGVAFTGNPSDPADDRFVVVAQAGEASVVSPESGVRPEKSIIEMAGGEVVRILRAEASTLVPEGERVLSDQKLVELGVLLWHIDRAFPIDLGGHTREDVLVDIEFKIEPGGELAVKQARPFLHAGEAAPAPTFFLEVPEMTELCGVFSVAREPREEYALKSRIRLRPGSLALPAGTEVFSGELFEEVLVGPELRPATAVSSGVFRVERFPGDGEITEYSFSHEQEFVLADDGGDEDRLTLRLRVSRFRGRGAEALEAGRLLDGELFLDPEVAGLDGSLVRADGGAGELFYGSCGYPSLPLWKVRVVLEDGSRIVLDERFRPEPFRATGPAALVAAEMELAGERFLVTGYEDLVYAAQRHNTHLQYWVVLDPPAPVAGVAAPVRVVEVNGPFLRDGQQVEPTVRFLDESFAPIESRSVESFERSLAGGEGNVRFLRGDVASDADIDMADAIQLLDSLFRGGSAPPCAKAADADDDGRVTVSDAVGILLHTLGTRLLPEPSAFCDTDPTDDDLGCAEPPGCR